MNQQRLKLVQAKLENRLNWLCQLNPGHVWSEYDWREVCQLQQEFHGYDLLRTSHDIRKTR